MSLRWIRLLASLGFVVMGLFCCVPITHAQTESATVRGSVTDPTGAFVPGATIRLVNIDRGTAREAMSNGSGFYTFPNISPGRYRMEVEKNGFKMIHLTGMTVNVQDSLEENFRLDLGGVSESITVEAGEINLNMTAAVGTVIDRQFVGNLPLNGRSFQSLILLTPGVVLTSSAGFDGGQFSANGQRGNANYFTVDGVSANIGALSTGTVSMSSAQAGNVPGLTSFGGTNNLVSIDALEEFKIQTSSYSAEFGRQPGGQISLVTRSGTNEFHGTLFEYLRNEVMDARDYFNKVPAAKPPLRQNQFGGTFSGPIFKNKTFFFFSYEGQRLRLPTSGIANVPSLRLRQLATPALRTIMNAYPVPTASTPELLGSAGLPAGLTPYNYSVSDQGTMDATSLRIDHMLSSKLTLFGRYNQSPSNNTSHLATILTTPEQYSNSTRTLTLGATWVPTPRLSNELRFNYSRQQGDSRYINAPMGGAAPITIAALATGYNASANDFGSVLIYFPEGASLLYLGESSGNNFVRQINVVDNVSLVKGSHQLKFGVDYRRLAPTYGPAGYSRLDFFQTQAAVINGIEDSLSINAYQGSRPLFDNWSIYGQDTWKLSPRLTLDLGLRWELNPAPHEASGKMPAMALGVTATDVSHGTLAPPGTPFYKTSYRAFAPRFGVAYQLNQTSGRETVLRGGFGVYYDLGNGEATRGYLSGLPFSTHVDLTNVPFPVPAALAAPPPFPSVTSLPITGSVFALDQNLKLPYTLQWNVALEQSLGRQQWLSLSYVASAARRLLMTVLENFPAGFTSGPRPNPNFIGSIYYTGNGPKADYHSLQVQYKARMTQRLEALVNYTWAHAIDEVSNEYAGFYLLRGNADFDIRHNLSAAVTYNLPTPTATPVLKQVFGNWSLDGIVHAQSGLPVDVKGTPFVAAGRYMYARVDYVPGQPFYIDDPTVPGGRRFNTAAFTAPPRNPVYPARAARAGNFGRNVLRGLPIWQADMAVGRSFNFTEKWKLQLKGEFFNIFNHPNFGDYGASYTNSRTFGVPSSTFGRSIATTGASLSSLYQIGGPRSVQLSLRLSF